MPLDRRQGQDHEARARPGLDDLVGKQESHVPVAVVDGPAGVSWVLLCDTVLGVICCGGGYTSGRVRAKQVRGRRRIAAAEYTLRWYALGRVPSSRAP